MPAGTAVAPGRGPGRLARLRMLPQHEIQGIELGIIHLYARAGTQVVDFLARQPAITRELAHRIHDIAVDGDIGIALVDQGPGHVDDRAYVFGGARLQVRRLQPEGGTIFMHGRGEAPRQISPILAVRGCPLDDLVVYVGDVAGIGDGVARGTQVALDEIEHGQHARMTDMDIVVVRHSADIHADFAGPQRLEFLFLSREGIMNFEHGTRGGGAPFPVA